MQMITTSLMMVTMLAGYIARRMTAKWLDKLFP